MAQNSLLSINDKVVLSRINKNGEEKEYYSRIVDFVDDANLMIDMPMENAMYIPLKVGREFNASFQTRTSIFKCRVKIADRVKENSSYFLVIKFISELEKIQRREYYRLECVTDIDFCVYTEGKDNDSYKWEKAVMVDLSGGGMRFNSKLAIDKDRLLRIRFPIRVEDEQEFLICTASIRFVNQMQNLKYEYRVVFDDLDNTEREKIIKHIFEEERRRRKNRS